jgi:hypothetical protein
MHKLSPLLAVCLMLVQGQFSWAAEKAASSAAHLYGNPQPIEIVGYSQDAMEPCISLDGQYLFFNNSNEDQVDTHIHYAKRLSDTRFQYLGLVPGVGSSKKDMAPTIDKNNMFFFTSLRSFDKDHRSIYCGKWLPDSVKSGAAKVESVQSVAGNISPTAPFWINMDCAVSPDGKSLVLARAQFFPWQSVPVRCDLKLARRNNDGSFSIDPRTDLLKAVNTSFLEYAPALTDDGLELYFTRAGSLDEIKKNGLSIMVARRISVDQPFSRAERLEDLSGIIEAPSLTLDKKELFFHKKDGKIYRIFKADRQR